MAQFTISHITALATQPAIIKLAQIMIDNGQDYSTTWEQSFPDFAAAGYHMYDMGDNGGCIVHDNGSACMNDARIVARVV